MWTDTQVSDMMHARDTTERAKDALIAEYAAKVQQLQLAYAKAMDANAALTDTVNALQAQLSELRDREMYRL